MEGGEVVEALGEAVGEGCEVVDAHGKVLVEGW